MADDEIWLALGEDIAADRGYDVDDTLRGEKHIMRDCSSARFLHSEGVLIKDRVWFSFFARLDQFMPDWSLSHHTVCHNGLELRIWSSVEEIPI